MTISPDTLAANYNPDTTTNTHDEIQAISEMATEYGYRLVPIHADNIPTGAVPPAFPDSPEDMVRRITWLQAAIKSATASGKAHKAEKIALEEKLIEIWAEVGRTGDVIDGHSAFISPKYSLTKRDPDTTTQDIMDALAESGLTSMVTHGYSYMTLLATFKEMAEQDIPMPDAIADIFQLDKGYEIKTTPAGKKRTINTPVA
jgi:hypothetical protein